MAKPRITIASRHVDTDEWQHEQQDQHEQHATRKQRRANRRQHVARDKQRYEQQRSWR